MVVVINKRSIIFRAAAITSTCKEVTIMSGENPFINNATENTGTRNSGNTGIGKFKFRGPLCSCLFNKENIWSCPEKL